VLVSSGNEGSLGLPSDPDIEITRTGTRSTAAGIRHPQVAIALAIGVGGVVGAIARYSVALGLSTQSRGFPWSTFVVNLTGSALLGFVLVLLIEQFPRGRLARPMIGTGLIGAYTTFSTFEVDAITLLRAGHAATAIIYLVASVIAGLAAVWLGVTSARSLLRVERWLQEVM
jgi:fluoride exporter